MADRVEILENARLVLPDRVVAGWLAMVDGRIAEFGEGRTPERGLDLSGDRLVPALVELHTDHLGSHYAPRPGVRWYPLGAVLAYDAQIAASGITTVFDSLHAGTDPDGSGLGSERDTLAQAIVDARVAGLFRAEHRTHLRCEIPSLDVIDTVRSFVARHPVGLISLMDHTPSQREFRDMAKYDQYAGRGGRPIEAIRAGHRAQDPRWRRPGRPEPPDPRGAGARARHSAGEPRRHHARRRGDVAGRIRGARRVSDHPRGGRGLACG